MEEILSKICRICLVEFQNNDLLVIDKFKIKQFKFIKVELNLLLTNNPVICTSCAYKLERSFDFKTKILNNFNYLNSFKSEETVIKIEELLTRPTFNEGVKLEVEKVCLFCLRYSQIDHLTPLDMLKKDWRCQKDLFETCIPEVDFTLVNDPFLCNNCIESLQNLFDFVLSYIDSEELFKGYVRPENDDLKKINLQKVLEKVKAINDDSDIKCGTDSLDIKEEIEALSPCPEVKIEDEDYVEDEESLGTDCGHKRSSRNNWPNSTKESHLCPYCSYKNHKRANLSSHLLVHANLSNETTYKFQCNLCSFNSKWRSSLVTHKLLHKKSPIFKCYNCSYETIYKKHLRRHMKLHQFKMYFCETCPYKTKIPARLEVHKCKPKPKQEKVELVKAEFEENGIISDPMELVQTRSEDVNQEYQPDKIYSYFSKIVELDNWYYLCNTCKYKTIKMSGIKDHVLKHQKKRKEKCHLCDYKFKYKKSLKAHIKNVHV